MRHTLVVLGGNMHRQADGTPTSSERAAISLATRFHNCFDVCLLRGDAAEHRYAIAAGARDVFVWDGGVPSFDIALFGSEIYPWGDRLPAEWAIENRAALVFDVMDVEKHVQGWRVLRRLEAGAREWLRTAGRSVIVMSSEAEHCAYISRHRRRKAGENVGMRSTQHDAPLLRSASDSWIPTRPRVNVAGLNARTCGDAVARVNAVFGIAAGDNVVASGPIVADPAMCAVHLFRYLRHHGFLAPATSVEPEDALRASAPPATPSTSTTRCPSPPSLAPLKELRIPQPLNPSRRRITRWPCRIEATTADVTFKWQRAPRREGATTSARRPMPAITNHPYQFETTR